MSVNRPHSYDPRTFKALTFHDATARFREGADTPRAYLERCLETIAEREPVVKAFAALNEASARARRRCQHARAGKPGARSLPSTACRSASRTCSRPRTCRPRWAATPIADNFPKRDNAAVWALRQAGAVILGQDRDGRARRRRSRGPTHEPVRSRRARRAGRPPARRPRSARA